MMVDEDDKDFVDVFVFCPFCRLQVIKAGVYL
jgi:hypothetical protein